MHSAAKLRRKSDAVDQINTMSIFVFKEYAQKKSAAEAEPINPAAGSRGEPTRLPVESPVAQRKQGIEVQVTRALFL